MNVFPPPHAGSAPHPHPHPVDLNHMHQQFAGLNLHGGASPLGHMNQNDGGPEIIDVGPSSKSHVFRGTVSASNMEGFIIRRLSPSAGQKLTWEHCSRARMPVANDELEREVREQQRKGSSVSKAIEGLKPNMQAQVLRTADDMNTRDPDPRARWNVVSLRLDKRQKGVGGVQETMAMRVIVKRTLDDTAAAKDPRRGPSGAYGAPQHGPLPAHGHHGMAGPTMHKGPPVRPEQPMPFNHLNGTQPFAGRDPRDMPGMPLPGGMRPDLGTPPHPPGPAGFHPRDPHPPPMHAMGGGGIPPGARVLPGGEPPMAMRGGPMGPGMAGAGGPGGPLPSHRNFPPQGAQPPPPPPPPMHPMGPQMGPMRPPPIAVPPHHGRHPEPIIVGNGPAPKRSNPGLRKHGGARRSNEVVEVFESDYDSSDDSFPDDSDLESRSTMPSTPGSRHANLASPLRTKHHVKRARPSHHHHHHRHRRDGGFPVRTNPASGGRRSPDVNRRERRRSDVGRFEDDEESLRGHRRRPSMARAFPDVRRRGSLKESILGDRRRGDDRFDEPPSLVEVRLEAKRRRERERAQERARERLIVQEVERQEIEAEEDEMRFREAVLEEEERKREKEEFRREMMREELEREARQRGTATARQEERYGHLRRTATDPFGDDLRAPRLRTRRFGLF